jgi:hypothetical protein
LRKITIAFLPLLLSALALAAPAPNPAAYTVNVHVSASRMVVNGRSVAYAQELDVVIDGKKYELESSAFPNALLALGDYKARLVKNERWGTYDSFQVYEFLLPGQQTRKFMVVGQTE